MDVDKQYILALDQGTTSSRAIIFDHKGLILTMAQKEFNQYFPKPGWVEHSPNEIWSSQIGVAAEALSEANIKPQQIAGIGITNQRETTVIWDKKTGTPIHNAIVWQDRRTSAICDQLKNDGHASLIQQKTGLIIDAYFSATKIQWLLDNVPGARQKAKNGELCFGTIDSWLVWKLTDGKTHVTDVSNASRTMLFNINTLTWDVELCQLFNIPLSLLPEVKSSSEIYGYTSQTLISASLPISGIAGDQQAALFGQMCITPGMVKNTYGTGCFMLMNTGIHPIISHNNLLTTVAWQINGETQYALEGSVFIGGAVVQWLRDGLKIIRDSSEVEALALQVESTEGVYVVPAFAGLGAPYWDQDARGIITGLTRGSQVAHIARAALESIAFQTTDVLKAMEMDSNINIKELRVDGGATVNNLLMQFQADILNCSVVRPSVTETTALGAAYLAGLSVGFWKDIDDIKNQWLQEKRFDPKMNNVERNNHYNGWLSSVQKTMK